MRKLILLSSVMTAVPFLTENVNAADCVTQDCSTLGYTDSADTGGCLKCPFGEYFLCEPKATFGENTGYAENCSIGMLLNNDGTCTTNKTSGKTPIGVVIYIGEDKSGYAMTVSPIKTYIAWSKEYVTTGIGATTDWTVAIKNFDACANTQKIIQQGDASTYPAAWAAYEYAPEAAPATKGKWCLPTPGMLHSLYTNLYTINDTIFKLGGKLITGENSIIWSSSEYSSTTAWGLSTSSTSNAVNQGGIVNFTKSSSNYTYHVRPVLAF